MTSYQLHSDQFGTLEVQPKPSSEQLKDWYANHYYQDPEKQYKQSYTKEELIHNSVFSKVLHHIAKEYNPNLKSFLDIGCGEGFELAELSSNQMSCYGVDFSLFGIKTHNPDLFKTCTIKQADLLFEDYFKSLKFDLILLRNVLEHVIDSTILLEKIKSFMHTSSILCIQVPHDVDNRAITEYLQKNNKQLTDLPLFCPPQHLRHFSSESLTKTLHGHGFREHLLLSDIPIESFLLSSKTDYYQNSFGSTAHELRVSLTNILSSCEIKDVISLYQSFAKLRLGRCLIGFYTLI